jgi:hypothetical protein
MIQLTMSGVLDPTMPLLVGPVTVEVHVVARREASATFGAKFFAFLDTGVDAKVLKQALLDIFDAIVRDRPGGARRASVLTEAGVRRTRCPSAGLAAHPTAAERPEDAKGPSAATTARRASASAATNA